MAADVQEGADDAVVAADHTIGRPAMSSARYSPGSRTSQLNAMNNGTRQASDSSGQGATP